MVRSSIVLALVCASHTATAFSFQPNSFLIENTRTEQKSNPFIHVQNHQQVVRDNNHGSKSSLNMAFNIRGGAAAATASSIVSSQQTPDSVFNLAFSGLALVAVASKVLQRISDSKNADKNASEASAKPAAVKSLQLRFLSVFWLIKCADWLQGPYFYEVYKSKVFNGAPATLGMISKIFLAGFASTALFGPAVGKLADSSGRKKGTLLFCALYTLGALSTKSPLLAVLLLGRLVNGIGTSLLFSAPESWLVGEAQKTEDAGKYLGETFGLAYAGDSIVAILAGKLSGLAAAKKGPTGPFELSTVFLAAGALLTSLLWKENVASSSGSDDGDEKEESSKPTIKEAVNVVKSDSKIMLVGAVQALFEAAMYIFVLQWPPAITSVIGKAFPGADTPYGTIFTCFMTCCLLGSTAFGQLVSKMSVKAENFTAGMLSLATISMACATIATIKSTASTLTSPMAILGGLSAAFFLFEACVGMYFPSIGTLRSKYVPDSHRGVIMNLFGIPLNALVITVFLISEKLGVTGALGVSTGALGLATLCMMKLKGTLKNSEAQAVAA